jgi:lipopolysaccharide transport system ATP-binding protein
LARFWAQPRCCGLFSLAWHQPVSENGKKFRRPDLIMSDVVISVENLSKRYLIGHRSGERERYTALRDVIAREGRNFVRKAVDAFCGRQIVQGDEIEEFWALRNLNFEIKKGEVIGIVGHNGAGKSTLLKILSRITEPTEGRVLLRGRVASLLGVGTGFHPELTGRENIFLNGAILGMSRREIRKKFDEIVAFAEVERFLDTPVKHFSSGMYVRLAFAVAAHLEPEILVVDEVLAVGDAEFQKKCLGKMNEASQLGGRTVLFVSHNMTAVQSLCSTSILMQKGKIIEKGSTGDIVSRYLQINARGLTGDGDLNGLHRKGEGSVRFRRISLLDRQGLPVISPVTGEELTVVLDFNGSRTERRPARIGITFYDTYNNPLFTCGNEMSSNEAFLIGAHDRTACRIRRFPLSAGRYKIGLFLERNGIVEDWLDDLISIDVTDGSFFGTARNLPLGWDGKTVLVDHEWRRLDDCDEYLSSGILDEGPA